MAWAGEGGGAVLWDVGGWREGGKALNLGLLCEDSRFDSSQSPSLVSEQGSGTTAPDPSGRGRGCCCRRCRSRGCRSWRCGGGGLGSWLPLLSPGLTAPPPGGLVVMPRDKHLHGDVNVTVTVTDVAQESLWAGFLEL